MLFALPSYIDIYIHSRVNNIITLNQKTNYLFLLQNQMNKSKFKFLLSISFLLLIIQASYGQGSRYTGEYKKSEPIKYVGKSNIVIEGLEISGSNEHSIALYDSENVIIRNNKLGPSFSKRGVYLYNCKNITIEDCTFENVQSGLTASNSQGIKFQYNDVLNVLGDLYGGTDTGSMVQFIQVSGSDNSISYNVCENISGKSAPEDIINIYSSNGTAGSPIKIKGNWIRGGGPSKSGGGINIGDWGGSHQIIEDNILVNPGQYGIAISGGNNMTLRNNKVYSKKEHYNNVGMIVYNWYDKEAGESFNITSSNNRINYTHADGYINNWWIPENQGIVSGKETNTYDKTLTASILPDKIIGRARDNTSSEPGDGSGDNTNPDNPDLTPPPVDGGGDNNSGSGPEVDPDPDEVFDPSITIYLDMFKRICVNTQGRVQRSAQVEVFNEKGNKIHSQRLKGYHTVIRKRFGSGIYDVKVKNGTKLKNQQIIIK